MIGKIERLGAKFKRKPEIKMEIVKYKGTYFIFRADNEADIKEAKRLFFRKRGGRK